MSKCNITIVPGSTMNDSRVSLLAVTQNVSVPTLYVRFYPQERVWRHARRDAHAPREERDAPHHSPPTTHSRQPGLIHSQNSQKMRCTSLDRYYKDSLFQVVDIIACSHSAWICTYVLYAFPPVSSSIHYITMYPTLSDG